MFEVTINFGWFGSFVESETRQPLLKTSFSQFELAFAVTTIHGLVSVAKQVQVLSQSSDLQTKLCPG
jgi:hypothetical protein